jgi:hypothetical protein
MGERVPIAQLAGQIAGERGELDDAGEEDDLRRLLT